MSSALARAASAARSTRPEGRHDVPIVTIIMHVMCLRSHICSDWNRSGGKGSGRRSTTPAVLVCTSGLVRFHYRVDDARSGCALVMAVSAVAGVAGPAERAGDGGQHPHRPRVEEAAAFFALARRRLRARQAQPDVSDCLREQVIYMFSMSAVCSLRLQLKPRPTYL